MIQRISRYFGAVKESETPERFKQLGIDEKYLPLVNTHAYMDDGEYPIDITTDEFQHDFYDRISKANVVFFLFKTPCKVRKEKSLFR